MERPKWGIFFCLLFRLCIAFFSPFWHVFWLTQKIISITCALGSYGLTTTAAPSATIPVSRRCCCRCTLLSVIIIISIRFSVFHQLLVAGCTSEVGIRCFEFIKTNGGRKPHKRNANSAVRIYRLSRRKRAYDWKVADGVWSTINLLHNMIHEVISLFNNHVCSCAHTIHWKKEVRMEIDCSSQTYLMSCVERFICAHIESYVWAPISNMKINDMW